MSRVHERHGRGRSGRRARPDRSAGRRAPGLLVLMLAGAAACGGSDPEPIGEVRDSLEVPGGPDSLVAAYQPEDSVIFEKTMAWARAERLDTLPLGESIVRLGRRFVGTPYEPGTLDPPGPELLVINLRALDCVTYVESMLAMARLLRAGDPGFASFKRELARIRYRDGRLLGYPSRLHYFSEWIHNNAERGIVRDVTRELGGMRDPEPIRFMTENAPSYRQLADPDVRAAIAAREVEFSRILRYVIPEDGIDAVAGRIRNGDIIAATSTLPGLDIAHTGLALWIGDRLHLMHAPLVGRAVEISDRPLADRIRSITTQDGIMVARPQ